MLRFFAYGLLLGATAVGCASPRADDGNRNPATTSADLSTLQGVALAPAADEVDGFDLDDANAYYTASEKGADGSPTAAIRKVPRTGGVPTTLAEDASGHAKYFNLLVDGGTVYWLRLTALAFDSTSWSTTLMSAPIDGSAPASAPTEVATVPRAVALSLDADDFFYTTYTAPNTPATLVRLSRHGGTSTVLATANGPSFMPLTIDERSVYWADGTALHVLPKTAAAGATPTDLGWQVTTPSSLLADESHVYVHEGSGVLDIVPIAGGPCTTIPGSVDGNLLVYDFTKDDENLYLQLQDGKTVRTVHAAGRVSSRVKNSAGATVRVDAGQLFTVFYDGSANPAGFRVVSSVPSATRIPTKR